MVVLSRCARDVKKLVLHDIQFQLCEFDKYWRVKHHEAAHACRSCLEYAKYLTKTTLYDNDVQW